MMNLAIYTDGSCQGKNERGASNNGGWAAVFFNDSVIVKMLHNISKDTTNNREELKAILYAGQELLHMAKIEDDSISATIYTDSAYCYNIITQWMSGWQRNGWKRGGNKEIENLDLIQALYQLFYIDYNKNFPKLQVNVVKCKGHVGIIEMK